MYVLYMYCICTVYALFIFPCRRIFANQQNKCVFNATQLGRGYMGRSVLQSVAWESAAQSWDSHKIICDIYIYIPGRCPPQL